MPKKQEQIAGGRIVLEKVDVKGLQDKHYSEVEKVEKGLRWERSAYRLILDGQHVAHLVCTGGWQSTRWEVRSLHGAVDSRVQIERVRGRSADALEFWLERVYKPEVFRTVEGLKAEVEANAREWRERRRRVEEQAERKDAARRDLRLKAQNLKDGGLEDLRGRNDLTERERQAIADVLEILELVNDGSLVLT